MSELFASFLENICSVVDIADENIVSHQERHVFNADTKCDDKYLAPLVAVVSRGVKLLLYLSEFGIVGEQAEGFPSPPCH